MDEETLQQHPRDHFLSLHDLRLGVWWAEKMKKRIGEIVGMSVGPPELVGNGADEVEFRFRMKLLDQILEKFR